jgi:hypothetical protein
LPTYSSCISHFACHFEPTSSPTGHQSVITLPVHFSSWPFLGPKPACIPRSPPTSPYWLTHFFPLATAGLSMVHNSFWHYSWTTDTERKHIPLKHKQCSITSLMTRIIPYTAAKKPQNSQNCINLRLHHLGLKEAVCSWCCKFVTLARNLDV